MENTQIHIYIYIFHYYYYYHKNTILPQFLLRFYPISSTLCATTTKCVTFLYTTIKCTFSIIDDKFCNVSSVLTIIILCNRMKK